MAVHQLLIKLLSPFLQSVLYNIASGLIMACCLRSTKHENESFIQSAKRAFRSMNRSYVASKNVNRTSLILSLLIFKSSLDLVAFCYFKGSCSKDLDFFNCSFLEMSILLSPINLLFSMLVMESDAGERGFAAGFAWGYYYGYLESTSHFLDNCIQDSKYKSDLQILPKRFVMLPANGNVIGALESADERITFVENTSSLKLDNAGVNQRQYFQSIYRFSPRSNEFEDFFCIVEQCAAVRTLQLLHINGIISTFTLQHEIKTFCEILVEAVKRNKYMSRKVEILLFTGNNVDFVNSIIKRRKELMEKNQP